MNENRLANVLYLSAKLQNRLYFEVWVDADQAVVTYNEWVLYIPKVHNSFIAA